ncbi:MAG: lipopolysaccharide biosynthesis protein [Verrucomicrobiota bacterium]
MRILILEKSIPMFQKIFHHRLFRQFVQMTFWRIFALAFGAAASIWAARCLGPDNLGISAMVIAVIGQCSLLVVLNLNPLLIREYKKRSSEEEKEALMTTVFTYRLVIGILLSLITVSVLWASGVSGKWWLAILAGVPYFVMTSNDANWALMAQENLPAQHRSLAIKSVITAALYFGFFRPGVGAGWDVVVQTIAYIIAIRIAWKWAAQGKKITLVNFKKLRDVWPLIKEGRWLFLTGIVTYIYNFFDSPLIGWLYSIHELGQYRSATLAVGAAYSFLLLIHGLLYPRFIEWQKQGKDALWQKQKMLFSFGLICLIPAIALTFWLAPWFYKLYGPKFTDAAYPFAILLTAKYVSTISAVFTLGLWAQHRDRAMLAITGAAAIFSLCMNLILIPHYGMHAAACVNLASEAFILIVAFFWSRKKQR